MNTTPAVTDPLQQLKRLILNGCASPHTRRQYERGLNLFFDWLQARDAQGASTVFTKALVSEYRAEQLALIASGTLSSATVNARLSIVRRLAVEMADNQMLDPNTAGAINRVKGAPTQGKRLGNWLTLEPAEQLLQLPDRTTLRGARDAAILAMFIGCGIRRDELADLTIPQIQQREGRWIAVDVRGKGNKLRSVPIPSWAKATLDEYHLALSAAGSTVEGRLFHSIGHDGKVRSNGLTAQALYLVVRDHAKQIGLTLAPHDLRRTFAQLARKGKADIEQIQQSLGHANIRTTQMYLGTQQDLVDAPCDRLGIGRTKA